MLLSSPPLAPDSGRQKHLLHQSILITGAFTTSLGAAMAVAWLTGAAWLDFYLPGMFYLKFTTAIGFVCAGASLLACHHGKQRLALAAGLAVTFLAAIALFEYLTGQHWGISQLVVIDFYHPAANYPGRMAPNTAVAFLCAGMVLLLACRTRWPRSGVVIVQELLAGVTLALGAEGMLGHLSAVPLAASWGSQTRMSVLTSLGFLALGSGLEALIWHRQHAIVARLPFWVPVLLGAAPLQLDLATPLGFPAGITYIPFLLCALWFSRSSTAYVFAAIATLLTLLGIIAKPAGEIPLWAVMINRFLTITVFWSIAFLIQTRRKSEITLALQYQNQNVLNNIIEITDDAFITKSLDGIVLSWNQGAERLFGYRAAEIVGRHISLMIPADFHDEETFILDNVRQGQNINDYETTRIHKNGHLIDVSISITATRDHNGKITGVSKIARDITKRKNIEAAIRQSEQRYQLVLQSMSVGVWEWDITSGALHWSERLLEILGMDQADFTHNFSAFDSRLHPSDKDCALATLNAHVEHRGPYDVEYRLRHQAGHYVWIHATGKAEWDAQGNPLRMTGSINDITSRKQSEERFRMVVQTAPYAMVMIDKSGTIVLINRKTEQFFGYDSAGLIGQKVEILVPPRLRTAHPDLRAKFFASPTISTADSRLMAAGTELTACRRDGSEFPAEIGLTPLATENGVMVLSTIIDITERKREEENARRFNERLEFQVDERTKQLALANQELEEFAFVASHDLKAPLRVIDNASKWIEEDLRPHLTNDTRENMALLRGRVKRMEKLLDDLLEYSRIGKKSDPKSNEIINGEIMMENVLGLLSPPPGFTIEVYPGFAALMLPRMPLQQILLNLINNAIKHHDKKIGHIEVAVENHPDHYSFTVKDDGPGIAPQFHQEIFKMFQTLKPRDQVEGSGMGLAMVRKHIDAAGGTLTLVSAEGEGSAFNFTWPKTPIIKAQAA